MAMALFPTISSGSVMCYGSTFGTAYQTGVVRFVNDSEQRWADRAPLFRGALVFTDISSSDVSILRDFWTSYKGAYLDAAMTNVFELQFTDVSGNAYDFLNCYFTTNEFEVTETKTGQFSLTLHIAQARKN